jgi:transcriptional regulator with XRE-family HTH domain
MKDTLEDRLYRELGKLVRAAREKGGMSQEALAASVGLTRSSIANLERGRQKIQIHTLYAIAAALGKRPEDILPREGVRDTVPVVDRYRHEYEEEEIAWVERVLRAPEGGSER